MLRHAIARRGRGANPFEAPHRCAVKVRAPMQ
jgi:hypothetical protein